MGFERMIHFPIVELPSALAYHAIDHFHTGSMELRLEKGSIKATGQKVQDMLGIPMGSKNTMGTLDNGGRVSTKLLKIITEDVDISNIDWCGYILDCLQTVRFHDRLYEVKCYRDPTMPVEKTSESMKSERLIPKGHRFSHKKTTTVPENTRSPKSCLRWKPTGRILKTICLRWVPTGKLLNSCTGMVENEPTHGSNVDIPHIHACKHTLGLSAGTSFNGQKQQ
ncbi:hypothetical protein Tco_0378072 [Tanacetum coccineum]